MSVNSEEKREKDQIEKGLDPVRIENIKSVILE